jgi:trehalose/maltose transport system substrate-binding protein
MKHRATLFAALICGLALAGSLGVAAAGTGSTGSSKEAAAIKPPPVKNAAAIKAKYKGQKITFVGDNAVGASHKRDLALVARFTRDTGIKIKLVPHPKESDASYSQLARNFSAKSSSIDVMMLDVVWPGAFAPYLVDLKRAFRKEIKKHAQGIIKNNTVGGKLVAIPWFGDFGILYYRTDLLTKYGYSKPPTTWAELGTMARKIQKGERESNSNFWGYVYQGKAYEGLTCDGLEWMASSGAGNFIDNGKVTINNSKAVTILNLMRSWVGEISPRGVTSYDEEGARNVFAGGNAAFLRNWPYAYAANSEEGVPVKGKFSVTVLPHGANGRSVGTVGGWQLGVSKFSKHRGASIQLVRYLTSAPVQRYDAIFNTNVPTILAVAKDKAVVKANPYLKPEIANVTRVTRPSRYLKGKYNQGSQIIFQDINSILNGRDAKDVLPGTAARLKRLLG